MSRNLKPICTPQIHFPLSVFKFPAILELFRLVKPQSIFGKIFCRHKIDQYLIFWLYEYKDFLDFGLIRYHEPGVSELDQEKLPGLLELKYQSITDVTEALGGMEVIRETFIGFQMSC